MGYYTEYSLSAYPVSKETPVPQERIEELNDRISGLRVMECGRYDSWFAYNKWCDHEEDMVAISKQFPEFLFTLHGKGQDSDDLWNAYFCDGRTQKCMAEIVYENPDMNYLLNNDAGKTEVS